MEKLYLGKIKESIKETQSHKPEKNNLFILGEKLYFEKHSWDCDWYWGFGYIVNKNLHTHAEIFIKDLLWSEVDEVFEETKLTNKDFWVFKDLLKQAYSLKRAAEVYRHGGHCTSMEGITDIIKSEEKEEMINKDLEIVLNTMWNFLEEILK